MGKPSRYDKDHIYSYYALRKAVGVIGILLPFVLLFGQMALTNEVVVMRSISFYYHTGMRDVFVGGLCAVALFMMFYAGYDWRDDLTGFIAGISAVGVAWFRTTEGPNIDGIGVVHLVFASLFFITLFIFAFFLFPISGSIARKITYRVCGIAIAACLIVILVYKIINPEGSHDGSLVYVLETIGLVAFGISWFVKGMRKKKKNEKGD